MKSFDPLEPVEVLDRLPEELRALVGTDLNSPMVYELLSFVCQVAKEECEKLEERLGEVGKEEEYDRIVAELRHSEDEIVEAASEAARKVFSKIVDDLPRSFD